ncbi:hypothetical protein STEG23_027421, partial [Scotinomys teguina]
MVLCEASSQRFTFASKAIVAKILNLPKQHYQPGTEHLNTRKMGPVFISILLTCVFLLVGKIFFHDFVEYVFCAFELVFFSFFYPYYSKNSVLLGDRERRGK